MSKNTDIKSINLLFNIYEIQIRNIKNSEFDQIHVIYCFAIPKVKNTSIEYDKILINLDFPNSYQTLKESKRASKSELYDSIMNQIFNSGCNETDVLVTYLGNKHNWTINTSSLSDLTGDGDKELSKKEKNKLFKLIQDNNRAKKEISDLLKQILKL
jgi:hypothetical protein